MISTADLQAILEAIPEAAVIVDETNHIIYASRYAQLVPFLKGERITDAGLTAQINKLRKSGRIIEKEYELTHPDAAVPWCLRVRVAPISANRVLVLVEDRSKSLQLDATRRDFVVNASHELKTPIGAISLLAETIHNNADDMEAVEHFSSQLMKESHRLTKLVQEIISLARLQDGKLPVKPQPVLVSEAIEDAIDRVKTTAEERDIRIFPTYHNHEDIFVLADLELLTSAIQNLLENAVRYSNPDNEVRVSLRQRDNVEIAVIDNGIGISAEDQERIFERFYRVDPARSRSTGGTGLGLSIVKHVITDLNGQINVESAPGKGARFTVSLPRYGGEIEKRLAENSRL